MYTCIMILFLLLVVSCLFISLYPSFHFSFSFSLSCTGVYLLAGVSKLVSSRQTPDRFLCSWSGRDTCSQSDCFCRLIVMLASFERRANDVPL